MKRSSALSWINIISWGFGSSALTVGKVEFIIGNHSCGFFSFTEEQRDSYASQSVIDFYVLATKWTKLMATLLSIRCFLRLTSIRSHMENETTLDARSVGGRTPPESSAWRRKLWCDGWQWESMAPSASIASQKQCPCGATRALLLLQVRFLSLSHMPGDGKDGRHRKPRRKKQMCCLLC